MIDKNNVCIRPKLQKLQHRLDSSSTLMSEFATLEAKALQIYESKAPERAAEEEALYSKFKGDLLSKYCSEIEIQGTKCDMRYRWDLLRDVDRKHLERLQRDLNAIGYVLKLSGSAPETTICIVKLRGFGIQ